MWVCTYHIDLTKKNHNKRSMIRPWQRNLLLVVDTNKKKHQAYTHPSIQIHGYKSRSKPHISHIQWIGSGDFCCRKTPIFNGKSHGFRLICSLHQSIDTSMFFFIETPGKTNGKNPMMSSPALAWRLPAGEAEEGTEGSAGVSFGAQTLSVTGRFISISIYIYIYVYMCVCVYNIYIYIYV